MKGKRFTEELIITVRATAFCDRPWRDNWAACDLDAFLGGVPSHVKKEKWRILPVDEVHDHPAALAGGHRRNAPWARVSRKLRKRRTLSLLLRTS
jgi:hypothetical protein